MARLANRRFVPFHFDLDDTGAAGGPEARKFVVGARKELEGSNVPAPPGLLLSADGEVLGEASHHASEEEVPGYDSPSAEERAAKAPLERACLRADLLDDEGTRRILAREKGDEAQYLLGRLDRFRGDFASMERRFRIVRAGDLAGDLRMERAYRFWAEGDFRGLRDHLADFPRESSRNTEARHFEGLARCHLGEREKTLSLREETIRPCSQDPWIYRADRASTIAKAGEGRSSSTPEKGSSLVGRIGYMGRRNPDLESRKPR